MLKLLFIVSLSFSMSAQADETQKELEAYAQNPKLYLQSVPQKKDQAGNAVSGTESLFSKESILTRNYVLERDLYRKEVCIEHNGQKLCLGDPIPDQDEKTPSAFLGNDRVEDLVDGTIVRTLEEMENRSLMSAALENQPWSGDYWATYRGSIASRYEDPNTGRNTDWKKNYDSFKNRPASDYIESDQIDLLSPAEKYSLFIGDTKHQFSEKIWIDGQRYYDAFGKVETWFGICHGWAPASYLAPRPEKTITLPSADGQHEIRFFPSDQKALISYLWANWSPPAKLIGGRCNDKNPEQDENGRVTSKDCFDTNPGTWHMALVNQIGVAKEGMVMDATYDYEVWNQPIASYRYTYFNPETKKPTQTLEDARVTLAEYPSDQFQPYRSSETKSVVGISMSVTYVVETSADHEETDSPAGDIVRKVLYLYDLELDANDEIIGGEWYRNAHPDFLWTIPRGLKPVSFLDRYATGEWTNGTHPPSDWLALARRGSLSGTLMGKLIEGMFRGFTFWF